MSVARSSSTGKTETKLGKTPAIKANTAETKKSAPAASRSSSRATGSESRTTATSARTTGATKRDPRNTIPDDKRQHYIEVAAYYIAERRGFSNGDETRDWLAAEEEIDRLLRENKLSA